MNEYFYLDKIPTNDNLYAIRLHHEKFPFKTPIEGSYNIIMARLCGLSYPDFLRMCRDILDATLIGRLGQTIFPYPLFKRSSKLDAFMKFLNARAEYAIECQKHPYQIRKNKSGDYIKEFYEDTNRPTEFRN